MLHGCMGAFPGKEGAIHLLAGLAPSYQTVGSLLRTPDWHSWCKKNLQKLNSANSLQWKKYAHLLLIRWIWPEAVFLVMCDPSINKL